ncbi:hypothetical protein TREAZ_0713 [Leadbettera azotonutricia ZAS-9]|uniref:Uncharacterized protein n=1 Tax=Leadbettera azotonutricia (strain ATCC BAA-888 / DSM 13862 / ZAS-9) TaxID=545695 RepID=F5YAB7_LEAAZ|nr:hypothetical protein TREAZ_0713 [Leadbettera azotonutricia ZAS-9]
MENVMFINTNWHPLPKDVSFSIHPIIKNTIIVLFFIPLQ